MTTRAEDAIAASDPASLTSASSSGSDCRDESIRARRDRTSSSFDSFRPASAQRQPAGALRARYSAVSPPVKPVAPKITRSYLRGSVMAPLCPGNRISTTCVTPQRQSLEGSVVIMRGRTFAALGAGATAGAATVALITTGVVGASLSILVAPPFSSPAAAEELQPFDDCEQLRQWYVDAALPMVGPWGLGGPGYYMQGGPFPTDMRGSMARDDVAGAATPETAVGSGDTGTNVQEAGVDEPDIAKTNGEIVVHLEGREVVLTDISGDDPRELSRVTLPKLLDQAELLLVGDKVVVFGTETYNYGGPVYGGPMTELDST